MQNQTMLPSTARDRCVLLRHPLFTVIGEPVFRCAGGDGTPVLAVRLGEQEVLLPLDTVQREFGITADSQDGRMLSMIAAALHFTAAIRIGDRLPDQVLAGHTDGRDADECDTGGDPDPVHMTVASARLRRQLIGLLNDAAGRATRGGEPPALTLDRLAQLEHDPATREQVQLALGKVAQSFGPNGVVRLPAVIADLAREYAYTEALRDRFLRRVNRMAEELKRLQTAWGSGPGRIDAGRADTLAQVSRLVAIAARQIADKFDDLDGRSADIMAALRDPAGHRSLIRSSRDWLSRSQHAWQPLLSNWDAIASPTDDGLPSLLNETYQFLAPRFMPVTSWQGADGPRPEATNRDARKVW
jgi:hypothetical protein